MQPPVLDGARHVSDGHQCVHHRQGDPRIQWISRGELPPMANGGRVIATLRRLRRYPFERGSVMVSERRALALDPSLELGRTRNV